MWNDSGLFKIYLVNCISMIQTSTILNIIDNSGGKKARCIKVICGYKKRYAYIGDIILVSIQSLRKKRKSTTKVKKGEIYKALIIRTNNKLFYLYGDSISFLENSIVILNKQNKLLGTKVFGSLLSKFRYSKYLRLVSLSAGLIK
jgi:large subunit ribosomal protein L14